MVSSSATSGPDGRHAGPAAAGPPPGTPPPPDDTRDSHMARVAACMTSKPGGSLVFSCPAAEGAYLASGAKGRGRLLVAAAAGHAALVAARAALAASGQPGATWADVVRAAAAGFARPTVGWIVGVGALFLLAPPPRLPAEGDEPGRGSHPTGCRVGLGCRPGEAAIARAAAAHEAGLGCLVFTGAVALLLGGCGGVGGAGPGALLLTCAPAMVQARWWMVGGAMAGPTALATARALASAPGLWPGGASEHTRIRSALLSLRGLAPPAAAASTDMGATAVAAHLAFSWAAGCVIAHLLDLLRRETFTARRLATAAAAREAAECAARGAAQAALAAAQAAAAGRALATARERAAHEARAQFMSLMCHEVRTPLNGCLASAELLLDTPLGPDQRELAATVRVSGSMLLATVSNCLDWFKTEAGKPLDLVRAEVSVGEVLNDVAAVVGAVLEGVPARAGATGAGVAGCGLGGGGGSAAAAALLPIRVCRPMLGPGVPPAFLGDGDRVRGVLLNLVTNAAKYTRAGAVALRVSVSPAGPHHRPAPHGPGTFGGLGGCEAAPPLPPTRPPTPPSAAAVLASSSLYAPSATESARRRPVSGPAPPPPPPPPLDGGGEGDGGAPRSSTGIEAEPHPAEGWNAVSSRWGDERRPSTSASASPREFLVFEVCDTGVGVDRACLGALFRRFVQGVEEGDGPGSVRAPRRAGGTGLGLAICCTQVKAMGGQIGAASRVGAGSTFWFSVPLLRVGRASGGGGEEGDARAAEAAASAAPAPTTSDAPAPPPLSTLRRTASWSSPDAFSDGHLRAGLRAEPASSVAGGEAGGGSGRGSGVGGPGTGPTPPPPRTSASSAGRQSGSGSRLAAAPPPGAPTVRRGMSGGSGGGGGGGGARGTRPPALAAGLAAARRRHSGHTLRRTASADAAAAAGELAVTVKPAKAVDAQDVHPPAPPPAAGRPVVEAAAALHARVAGGERSSPWPASSCTPGASPPLSQDSVHALTDFNESGNGCGGSGSGETADGWRALAAPRHDAPGPGAPRQSMEIRRTALDTSMLKGRRVLLAEDNLINQKVAVRMLRSLGLSVDVACDGREAVDAILAAPPARYDAVLMDMSMPVLGGVAATAALRAAGCGVPVVAMTANASDADRDACLGSGMDGHLVKPVLPGRLAEALVLVLSGRARFADETIGA